MLETTHGIVLHYNRYGDDSAIVDIFTQARGSVAFLVRDRRRQRRGSVQTPLLRPLNIVEVMFDYRPSASLQRLQEVHMAFCYTSLPYDPLKETVALFLSEFLHNALRSEVVNERLYHYIIYSLQWFDATGEGLANFHIAFLVRMTHYLGFWPYFDKRNRLPFFDLKEGIFTDTRPLHEAFLRGEEAEMLPKLLRISLHNMHKFRFSRVERGRILDLLTSYYQLHVPEFRDLRSLSVLREVLS